MMARVGSRVRKRVWRKVVVAVLVGVAVIVALIYWQRYEIAIRYMEGNKKAQETAILLMLETARPVIERELKMTLPQKILSSMTGKRNQGERQTDALKDVRAFGELGFENHWLTFKDVHNLSSINGFDLHRFGFALEWKRGKTDEVLSVFDVNFFTREVGEMLVNQDCSFFSELRLYLENKAKEN